MPFATMTVQADEISATLNGSGNYTPPYGERWVDLMNVQYVRIQYMASADTPGSSMTIMVQAWIYNAQGQPILSSVLAPSGPSVGQTTVVSVGPWVSAFPQIVEAGDVKMFVYCQGTPNADVTINWVELQFR